MATMDRHEDEVLPSDLTPEQQWYKGLLAEPPEGWEIDYDTYRREAMKKDLYTGKSVGWPPAQPLPIVRKNG